MSDYVLFYPTDDIMEVDRDSECDSDGDEVDSDTDSFASHCMPEDIEKRIYITTDNASNISKAVEQSTLTHIRCFARVINLSGQSGLKCVSRMLAGIRSVVKLFRKSYKAKYALQISKCIKTSPNFPTGFGTPC